MDFLHQYHSEVLHCIMTFEGGFLGLYAVCAYGTYASAQTGNLMEILVEASNGDYLHAFLRIGAFIVFCGGIVASWLLHEFCTLPMQHLCLLTDAAALAVAANLPSTLEPLLCLYPIFFAASFQWGTFGSVNGSASASLFITGNLKTCVTRWLKYAFYHKTEDRSVARLYTAIVACYVLGGVLGCAAVKLAGVQGAYVGFLPLGLALAMISLGVKAKP